MAEEFDSVTCWGFRPVRRSLPDRAQITRRTAVSASDLANPASSSADPPCTLPESDRRYDVLSSEQFSDWSRTPRCGLSFDGAEGVTVTGRAEVYRCEIACTD